MAEPGERLFVYGTLKPGHGNHRRISDHVYSVNPGTIQGILVDLGAFPALIHGNGRVKGAVLAIDAEALSITDFIEGCHADRERSLYIREKVEVDLGGDTIVESWTYTFATPDHILGRPRLVVGDADGVALYAWPAE